MTGQKVLYPIEWKNAILGSTRGIQISLWIQKDLHYPLANNSKEIGEILISKGADINAKDIIYLNIIILFFIKII